jgi:hypothetical protein
VIISKTRYFVVRQFSVYEYDLKNKMKTQTTESDSAVRFIRKHHKTGNLEVITTNSWEMFPTNNPNPENAMKLTLYFTIQKEEKLNDFITTKTSKSLGQKNFSILLMVHKK